MKRHLVSLLFTVALLAFQEVANGQNLQLILEGPFVVCENLDAKSLTIFLPNLQGTHYVPGFTSNFGNLPLGTNGHGGTSGSKYHVAKDEVAITIHADHWPDGNSHPMALNPPRRVGQEPAAYFYSENGDCHQLNRNLASIMFTVPFPDEVWATNPTGVSVAITDHNGKYKGECQQHGKQFCPDATKLVLRYKGVDLKTLEIDTMCKAGAGKCTANDNWHVDTSAAIGGEFEIALSAEPIPSHDEEGHVKTAFRSASQLSGVDRYLTYPPHPKEDVVTHQVCQTPMIFLCKHGGACPTM
jgi:hypothetical protein